MESKNLKKHDKNLHDENDEKPINPYYTPEEEAAHRERVRKMFSGERSLRNTAILMIIPAIVGAAELVYNAFGTSIPDYLEQKYHREFIQIDTRKDYGSYYADVILKNDPGTKIEVRIIEALPWYQEYSDNYFEVEGTRYINNWIKSNVTSMYANKLVAGGRVDMSEQKLDGKLEKFIDIGTVKFGPSEVPEVFSDVRMSITFVGDKENEEKMVREMHQLYQAIWHEFPSNGTSITMKIIDTRLFTHTAKREDRYFEVVYDTYEKIPLSEKKNYTYWEMDSMNYKDIEQSKINFEYFRIGDIEDSNNPIPE